MTILETAGEVIALIVAGGGGAITSYFWGKATKRFEASSINSRLELIKDIDELSKTQTSSSDTGGDFSDSDRMKQVIISASQVQLYDEIALQINKSFPRWKSYLWPAALILLGCTVMFIGFAASSIFLYEKPTERLWCTTGVFVIGMACSFGAACKQVKYQKTASKLVELMSNAQNTQEIQTIVTSPLQGSKPKDIGETIKMESNAPQEKH